MGPERPRLPCFGIALLRCPSFSQLPPLPPRLGSMKAVWKPSFHPSAGGAGGRAERTAPSRGSQCGSRRAVPVAAGRCGPSCRRSRLQAALSAHPQVPCGETSAKNETKSPGRRFLFKICRTAVPMFAVGSV